MTKKNIRRYMRSDIAVAKIVDKTNDDAVVAKIAAKRATVAAQKATATTALQSIAQALDGKSLSAAIPQAMSPEAVSAVTKSRAKAVAAAKDKVAAKIAAKKSVKPAPKKSDKPATEKKPREAKPLDAKVVELIALLKLKKGATNEEAAEALKLKSKGKAAHQSPSAQVRAMIRDKVRKLHTVTSEHETERAGTVHRITK